MSSERADEPATPDNPHGIPGQALASQREAMGWTVEQVADQLKLQVRQVVALEAGDYASLPSPAVTRGFVRAYAKLMKMDPAPLVAQIAMDTPPTPDSSATVTRRASPASFSESRFPSHGKRRALPLGWIVGGVVVVVAAAAAWHFGVLQHRSGEAETAAPSGTVTEPAAAGSAGSANGNAVETLQNPSVPLISVPGQNSGASAPATNGAAPAGNAPAPAPANQPAAPAQAAPAQTAPASTPAAAPTQKPPGANAAVPGTAPATAQPAAEAVPTHTGANALVLNVREDSWIQVTPAKGGAALISRLVKAGSTETVNVDQPVRVVVGNPDGVTATLRGNAVSLPSVPGKKLARINLQ
jgi:cytoskeleton protein RodZ